ncbi:oligosaccharide flippase family protein [Caminibacter sp.]
MIAKLLSKNILIYGGINALKSVVPIILLPILTKYLSKDDFGVLSLVETTILFVTPFILLNINAAVNVNFFKMDKKSLKEYITNALLISFLSFLICFILAFLFKNKISEVFNISSFLVVWIVVFALLRIVTSVVLGIFQVRQEPVRFGVFALSQTVVDFVLSYFFVALYKWGYIGRLEGVYISFFVFSLIGLWILWRFGYLGTITFKYTKEILNFSLPLIPHSISGTVMAMSDRYFISYFVGNAQVGVYTVSYQIAALMLLIGVSVNQAWSPMVFKFLQQKNVKNFYKFTFYLIVLFAVVFVFILGLKNLLFSLFVNPKFFMAKEYFFWLLVGFLFQSLYFLVTNVLFFEKRTKTLAAITITGAVFNIIMNFFMIKKFGTIGVAYATALTWFILFVAVSIASRKILRGYEND